MGQLVFPQIPVNGCLIDMAKHGLPDGPGDPMCLSAYNVEAVHVDGMSCFLSVLIYKGGGSKVYF